MATDKADFGWLKAALRSGKAGYGRLKGSHQLITQGRIRPVTVGLGGATVEEEKKNSS